MKDDEDTDTQLLEVRMLVKAMAKLLRWLATAKVDLALLRGKCLSALLLIERRQSCSMTHCSLVDVVGPHVLVSVLRAFLALQLYADRLDSGGHAREPLGFFGVAVSDESRNKDI